MPSQLDFAHLNVSAILRACGNSLKLSDFSNIGANLMTSKKSIADFASSDAEMIHRSLRCAKPSLGKNALRWARVMGWVYVQSSGVGGKGVDPDND
jgi:hypothetical protein